MVYKNPSPQKSLCRFSNLNRFFLLAKLISCHWFFYFQQNFEYLFRIWEHKIVNTLHNFAKSYHISITYYLQISLKNLEINIIRSIFLIKYFAHSCVKKYYLPIICKKNNYLRKERVKSMTFKRIEMGNEVSTSHAHA